MPRHFLNILDLTVDEAHAVLARAKALKTGKVRTKLLDGKTVILIFEKASTRTRVSFEVAVRQLGGQTVFLTPNESQLGRNEPLKDTARVLSRYADALVVRTFGQEKLETLVEWGTIPVVNALTDQHHPCQVMSDVLTMFERTPDLCSLKVGWIGDGNNMAQSWIEAAALFKFELALACPSGYTPDLDILAKARSLGARITLTEDPVLAARGAHYLNTDVWASMGQEAEQLRREAAFEGYQLDDALLAHARPGCKVMHCLPAHQGEEVTDPGLRVSTASIDLGSRPRTVCTSRKPYWNGFSPACNHTQPILRNRKGAHAHEFDQESRPGLFRRPGHLGDPQVDQEHLNYKCDVITMTADLGQEEELDGLEAKALSRPGPRRPTSTTCARSSPGTSCSRILRSGAVYEGRYLLGTSIARPLDRQAHGARSPWPRAPRPWPTGPRARATTRSASS